MTDLNLIQVLRSLSVETGSLACLGCSYEHNCGIHGCAVMRAIADRLAALQAETAELRTQHRTERREASEYGCTELGRLRAALSRVKTERDAANNTKLELFFGRGVLGVDTVAENEDSPFREILIRRLQAPVIPIGSALGDKGKTVDELENILVRMHFENVESALVLERALQIVLGSFGEPRRGAQGEV